MGNILAAAAREKTTRRFISIIIILANMTTKIQTLLMASKTSAENKVGLPEELVIQILCKLPVKSLTRFKTVCKSWNLLISSPVFITEYLHRESNHQLGGTYSLYNPRAHRSEEKEDNLFPVDITFIVGACNGIICLATSHPQKRLLLFNPFTKEFSFVPDGLSIWGFYGFCYLPNTQQYQIISFSYQPGVIEKVDIKVLTLGKTTSLREVKGVSLPGLITKSRQATSGTTMVWLGHVLTDSVKAIVICYDVIEERFSITKTPPPYGVCSRSLGVLKDSIIMFVSTKLTYFDIWMLLVDDVSKDKSWLKYQKVGPLEPCVLMNPIGVCWDDRWILCSNVRSNKYGSCDLLYYDLETNQVKDYEVTYPPIREFVNYVKSLVSIYRLVPCMDTTF